MPTNVNQFNLQLKVESKKIVRDDLVRWHRDVAFEALKRIVMRTPADIGITRNNWQTNIGTVDKTVIDTPDKTGAAAIAGGAEKLAALAPFQVVYISNSVEHILVLEDGLFIPKNPGPSKDPRPHRKGKIWVKGGYSVQAPQGMVKVTIAELQALAVRP